MGQAYLSPPIAVIVEDDRDLRELAAALLEETSLKVVECASAEAALSVMHACGNEVAIIFVDICLPGFMDGVDFAREAHANWPRAKIVVTSGDPGDRLRSLPHDTLYMPKPWRANDVLVVAESARAAM